MADGDKTPDGNDLLALVSATRTDRQIGERPQRDGTPTSGPWAGQRPTIVQTASPIRPPAAAGTSPATNQPPHRKSHLARLVDAIQKSQRLQAAQLRRRTLRLVQGERT
jgi:hypothetical protein